MAADMTSESGPLFLVGATGTGKSALALELARAFESSGGAAILAMDALQVYRGADIGTSKPSAAERAEVPHGGLDLVEFGVSFDVARYLKHAAVFLQEQREAGRRVIIVGGTGLYFRALTQGLCEASEGSDELRTELNKLSLGLLQARLERIDPELYETIDIMNPRRLVRAIEVKEATGRSLREWQEETPEPLVANFTAFWIQREKGELAERIEGRVEAMFAQGWVEEVRGLVERFGVEAVQGFAGIGYREIGEWVYRANGTDRTHGKWGTITETAAATIEGRHGRPGGRPSMEKVKGDILVATRQYAKRQLTWFQREPNLQSVMLSGTQPFPAALLPLP